MAAGHPSYAVLAEIARQVRAQQPSLLAKQAAYSLLYAVPSLLITLVSLAAIVDKNTGAGVSTTLRERIAQQAPVELRPLLDSLVQYAIVETSEQAALVAVVISLAVAIWGGAGGVGALIYAINQVYDIRDTRSFFKSAALQIGVVILGGVMVIAALVLLAFGRGLGEWLVARIGRGATLVDVLSSGPVWGLALLFAALLLLYWVAPDIVKSFRWIVPGAVFATLAIALAVALLSLILSFSNPGTAYGAAGSVLILLWALYLLSQIVVVGAIVNAVLGRRYDRTLRQALRDHPDQRRGRKAIVVSEYR
jgi:membrane protein